MPITQIIPPKETLSVHANLRRWTTHLCVLTIRSVHSTQNSHPLHRLFSTELQFLRLEIHQKLPRQRLALDFLYTFG